MGSPQEWLENINSVSILINGSYFKAREIACNKIEEVECSSKNEIDRLEKLYLSIAF